MTTIELEEEEERRNQKSGSGAPPVRYQKEVEIYAFKRWEKTFKRDK